MNKYGDSDYNDNVTDESPWSQVGASDIEAGNFDGNDSLKCDTEAQSWPDHNLLVQRHLGAELQSSNKIISEMFVYFWIDHPNSGK